MNLKEQLYVCTLADTGNLTQAAKLLFISQPALSLYISNLENSLGARLFDRIGKQFVLTQAGELYVKNAKAMLKLRDSFLSEFSQIANGQKERLRVGLQDIRSHYLIPIILPQISRLYPQVRFTWYEGYSTPMEERLLNHELDIFFCNCQTLKKELEYIPIINDELVFITPKDHPLTVNAKILDGHTFPWLDLTTFKEERFIVPLAEQSLRKYSDQVLKTFSIPPINLLTMRKISNIVNLVNVGYGVGFCMASYINSSLFRTSNLSIYSVMDPPITATFYAVYNKNRKPTPAALSLIDLIQAAMDKQASDLRRAERNMER